MEHVYYQDGLARITSELIRLGKNEYKTLDVKSARIAAMRVDRYRWSQYSIILVIQAAMVMQIFSRALSTGPALALILLSSVLILAAVIILGLGLSEAQQIYIVKIRTASGWSNGFVSSEKVYAERLTSILKEVSRSRRRDNRAPSP